MTAGGRNPGAEKVATLVKIKKNQHSALHTTFLAHQGGGWRLGLTQTILLTYKTTYTDRDLGPCGPSCQYQNILKLTIGRMLKRRIYAFPRKKNSNPSAGVLWGAVLFPDHLPEEATVSMPHEGSHRLPHKHTPLGQAGPGTAAAKKRRIIALGLEETGRKEKAAYWLLYTKRQIVLRRGQLMNESVWYCIMKSSFSCASGLYI